MRLTSHNMTGSIGSDLKIGPIHAYYTYIHVFCTRTEGTVRDGAHIPTRAASLSGRAPLPALLLLVSINVDPTRTRMKYHISIFVRSRPIEVMGIGIIVTCRLFPTEFAQEMRLDTWSIPTTSVDRLRTIFSCGSVPPSFPDR